MTGLEQWDHGVSIAAGVATIIAAGVAVWGIWSWRHQLRGTTEYRAAVRAYKAIARLRDRIRSTRKPWNHLIAAPEGEPTQTREFVERERKEYWNYFREVIRADLAMLQLRVEVELLWGTEATAHLDALDESARQLRGGYMAYFEHRRMAVSGEPHYFQLAAAERKIVFDTTVQPTDTDKYGDQMERRASEALAYFRGRAGLPESTEPARLASGSA